jgi:Holliday junction resolvasome RuvABC DNA-binding subunit
VAPVQKDQGTSVSIADQSSDASQDLSAYSDAVSALLTLGYKATDADLAVRRAAESLGGKVTTEELIRKALGR